MNILDNYFTVSPPFDARLAIRREGGINILTWTGGGQLQRADRVTGPWQTLTAAQSPCTVLSPVPATFYRVTASQAGESLHPLRLRRPHAHAPRDPAARVRLEREQVEDYMQLRPLAEGRGFLYCYPDATIERLGYRFWNATDACCDFGFPDVDDAGYLRGLIEEIARRFAVDRKRIYLVGHLNGGFMAYRMACESADLIAGIASLAGHDIPRSGSCAPSQPVNVLHIHGTADDSLLTKVGLPCPVMPSEYACVSRRGADRPDVGWI